MCRFCLLLLISSILFIAFTKNQQNNKECIFQLRKQMTSHLDSLAHAEDCNTQHSNNSCSSQRWTSCWNNLSFWNIWKLRVFMSYFNASLNKAFQFMGKYESKLIVQQLHSPTSTWNFKTRGCSEHIKSQKNILFVALECTWRKTD